LKGCQSQCFNPYFTGSSTSTIPDGGRDPNDLRVSILILLEVLLQLSLYTSKKDLENMFQSLFYWKFYFNGFMVASRNQNWWVSILILLEVLLQQTARLSCNKLYLRFNPYFTGSSTSTCWRKTGRSAIKRFQSLFYWKFYFNQYIKDHKYSLSNVSILILLEVLLQLSFCWRYFSSTRGVSILILLEVLLQLIRSVMTRFQVDICFNPYFTGSSTSTRKNIENLINKEDGFNPYFTGSSTSTAGNI